MYAQLEDWNAARGALVCNLDVLVYFTRHVCADCTHKNRRLLWPKTYVLAWCLNSEKKTQKKSSETQGRTRVTPCTPKIDARDGVGQVVTKRVRGARLDSVEDASEIKA
jgi:hypothetical protein